VQKVVQDVLKARSHDTVHLPATVHRPWGTYASLKEGDGYKVKRITVRRANHCRCNTTTSARSIGWWYKVTAIVQIGEVEHETLPGQYRYIPLQEKHRLTNTGDERARAHRSPVRRLPGRRRHRPSRRHLRSYMSQVHSNLHRSAWADWWEGTRRTDIWWTLAWFDIVLRYRRSMLGPLWLTLSMGAMIGGMGPLYSVSVRYRAFEVLSPPGAGHHLLGLFLQHGDDACNAFVGSSNYLKQGYFPISLFVWRSIVAQPDPVGAPHRPVHPGGALGRHFAVVVGAALACRPSCSSSSMRQALGLAARAGLHAIPRRGTRSSPA
jgi:mannose-6-phosphate isomerase-like protein (cupin superfamily)